MQIEPSGPGQIRAAVVAAAGHPGPVYLRLKRSDGTEPPDLAQEPLEIGRLLYTPATDGKAVVAAYMLANERALKRGLAISFARSSLRCESARIALKPAMPTLVTGASVPPQSISSARPSVVRWASSGPSKIRIARCQPHNAASGVASLMPAAPCRAPILCCGLQR